MTDLATIDADLLATIESLQALRAKVGPLPPPDLRMEPYEGERDGWPGVWARYRMVGKCSASCSNGWRYSGEGSGYVDCDCRRVRELCARLDAAGMPSWSVNVVAEYRPLPHDPVTMPRLDARALELKSGTNTGSTWTGDTGRGKSRRAAVLARLCIDVGMDVRWVDWPSLLKALKNAYAEDRPTALLMAPLQRADLVVVDDVGAGGKRSEWVEEICDEVIGHRADRKKAIVATSNLPARPERGLPTLAQYLGDRTWSRLCAIAAEQRLDGPGWVDRRAER